MSIADPRIDDLANDDWGTIAERVDRAYRTDFDAKQIFAIGYEEALRYLEGKHWSGFQDLIGLHGGGPETSAPFLATGGAQGVYPKVNKVLPAIRTLGSHMLKNRPHGVPRAMRTDPSRVLARTCEQLLETLGELNDEDVRYVELVLWMLCTGTVLAKDFFTTELDVIPARPVRTAEGVTLRNVDGEEETEESDEDEVEMLGSRSISFFEALLDPQASDLTGRRMRWIGEAGIWPVETVRQMWDRDAEGFTGEARHVEPERVLSSPLHLYNRLRIPGVSFYGGGDMAVEDSVVVKEMYYPPTQKHRRGRLAVVADNRTLFIHDTPYYDAGFWNPYTLFVYFPFTGRLTGIGALDLLVPAQKRRHGVDAFQAVYRWSMAMPKVLASRSASVTIGHWTGGPQVVEYNEGSEKPEVVAPPPYPAQISEEGLRADQDIEETAGTQALQERTPGSTNYSMVAYLAEQSKDQHGITYTLFEKAIERRDSKRLMMLGYLLKTYGQAHPYWKLARQKLRLSDAEIAQFFEADLRDSVEVRVETGSSVPRSRVLTQQAALEFLKMGLLDVDTPDRKRELLDLFGLGNFQADSADVEKAQFENMLLLDGGIETHKDRILQHENHGVHGYIHLHCFVQNYESLSAEQRQAFVEAIEGHRQQEAMLMAQNPAQGAADQTSAAFQTHQVVPGSRGQLRPMAAVGRGAQGGEPAGGVAVSGGRA